MKVGELVAKLKDLDQDLEVVVDGYEAGSSIIKEESVRLVYINILDGRDWCGTYGDPCNKPDEEDNLTPMVIIER